MRNSENLPLLYIMDNFKNCACTFIAVERKTTSKFLKSVSASRALHNVFGPFYSEIRDIVQHRLNIEGQKHHVPFLFVGDYKVYYAPLRMKQAISFYPCPWCRTPMSKMDQILRKLTMEDLEPRSGMQDLLHASSGTKWQNKGTKNSMRLSSSLTGASNGLLIVPLPLHIKFVLINKVVQSIDKVLTLCDFVQSFERSYSTALKHNLVASSSHVGARRKSYYACASRSR